VVSDVLLAVAQSVAPDIAGFAETTSPIYFCSLTSFLLNCFWVAMIWCQLLDDFLE
jgi:hypothetical protein